MEVHKPVLVNELISNIPIDRIRVMVDATVGLGGHAINFLKGTNLRLIGLDIDEESLKIAERNLIDFQGRVELIEANYKDIKDVARMLHLSDIDFICADLGLSSYQLSCERRGFSFMIESPLDMRYSKKTKITAEELVNTLDKYELEWIFLNYGEEARARQIAEEIIRERKKQRIKTTMQLVDIVHRVKGKRERNLDSATLVFQALRIAVNDELNNLKIFLKSAFDVLSLNGYLAVISYHSLEDRIVKNAFKLYSARCRCNEGKCKCEGEPLAEMITRKVIKPTKEEVRDNRRARSAKLRIIKKIAELKYSEYIDNLGLDRHICYKK
jgi:16S rRNA (cytosine1402-N4)-methyltransferase